MDWTGVSTLPIYRSVQLPPVHPSREGPFPTHLSLQLTLPRRAPNTPRPSTSEAHRISLPAQRQRGEQRPPRATPPHSHYAPAWGVGTVRRPRRTSSRRARRRCPRGRRSSNNLLSTARARWLPRRQADRVQARCALGQEVGGILLGAPRYRRSRTRTPGLPFLKAYCNAYPIDSGSPRRYVFGVFLSSAAMSALEIRRGTRPQSPSSSRLGSFTRCRDARGGRRFPHALLVVYTPAFLLDVDLVRTCSWRWS
ncbi:hypothetical protein B0H12DRAFT_1122989 [Mycena haematopus]|nr:hypothetical protein B0H12DRAFT_1122989 [Mycena haematopus]